MGVLAWTREGLRGVGPAVRPRRWVAELIFNRILTHLPHNGVRVRFLHLLGMTSGPHVYFFGGSEFIAPRNLAVVANCHIGRYCQIDSRGGITIGSDVVIASHVLLITADHDAHASDFGGRLGAITIGDRAWLASRCVVLRGVTIGEGAVVAAGAVVSADVAPWTIVGGVPSKPIGLRSPDVDYRIDYGPTWY